jgi:hypothetical protein
LIARPTSANMVVNETRKRLLRQLNSRWIKGRIVRAAPPIGTQSTAHIRPSHTPT